jgi:hypothetical protein
VKQVGKDTKLSPNNERINFLGNLQRNKEGAFPRTGLYRMVKNKRGIEDWPVFRPML